MRREVSPGIELDDDRERIDVATVHGYVSEHAYWALGRPYDAMEHLIRDAARVVGLYDGVARSASAAWPPTTPPTRGCSTSTSCPSTAGRGLGVELVREAVENGPQAQLRWILHTQDMHRLYARFGFATPERALHGAPRKRLIDSPRCGGTGSAERTDRSASPRRGVSIS